jgi:DNA-directed RNA polymerase subunit F
VVAQDGNQQTHEEKYMTIETAHNILQWSTLISVAILLIWFIIITVAHDILYRMYSRRMKITVEQFDAIHYAGMTIFKILIVVFHLAPLLALYIIR